MLKKLLVVAIIAFFAYYILRSPDGAAVALRGASTVAIEGLKDLAESLARFVDALFN